jgi:hypothetical protein
MLLTHSNLQQLERLQKHQNQHKNGNHLTMIHLNTQKKKVMMVTSQWPRKMKMS